jgi:hypothetical protein
MERLGFLEWHDPYEWTETNDAARAHAIRGENRLFKHTVSVSGSDTEQKRVRAAFVASYEKTEKKQTMQIPQENPQIIVQSYTDSNRLYYWKYVGDHEWKYADDLDFWSVQGAPYVAFTHDSSRGKLDYTLYVKTPKSHWIHKRVGGSDVAIMNHRVYFIEGDSPLRYTRLVSLSLYTGENRRIVYEEVDPSVELTLIKGCGRTLFLLGADAGYEQLRWIMPNGVIKRLEPTGVSFFPVGYSKREGPIYFVRLQNFTKPWKLVGASWKLNREIENSGIEICLAPLGILITKFQGVRTVWSISSERAPKQLDRGFFTVIPWSIWPFWRGERNTQIWVHSPISPPYALNSKTAIKPYADFKTGESISSDGMPVRWLLMQSGSKESKGLMLDSYGAYGLPTNFNTARWRPWIDAGWAVALLFVRGGGDSNEAWAELGRLGGKLYAVCDVEACCKDLQKRTGCGPGRTCIFGRSAGGLIIGNMISKHPRGELFKCVYAESPYVDLLKTAANPKLPLTEYEYRDFGNPTASPADFEQTLRISPIHTLPSNGAPGVHVLCRAGKDDIQVYPYESLKWILSLRGKRKDTTKILYVNTQAHQAYGGELFTELAEDFLIINHWMFDSPP